MRTEKPAFGSCLPRCCISSGLPRSPCSNSTRCSPPGSKISFDIARCFLMSSHYEAMLMIVRQLLRAILSGEVALGQPRDFGEGRLDLPFARPLRGPGFFPGMIQQRRVSRAFFADARVPFGHVARFGGVQAEAEAEADLAVVGDDARDQDLFSACDADGVHVEKSAHAARGLRPLRATRP